MNNYYIVDMAPDFCSLKLTVALCDIGLMPVSPVLPLATAQKWLREEKNVEVEISYTFNRKSAYDWNIYDMRTGDLIDCSKYPLDSYGIALHEGIEKAVQLINSNQI